MKSISISVLNSRRFWCLDTKTKLISIQTLNPSHFRPPLKKQVNYDPYTEIKSFLTTHTKRKSSSMLTLKPRDFRLANKPRVNFVHPHKNKSVDFHIKNESFSARTKKNKSIAIPAPKPCQFWSLNLKPNEYRPEHSISIPRTKVDFGTHTRTKSISTTHTKPSQSIPTPKTTYFRPAHKNRVNSNPNNKTK